MPTLRLGTRQSLLAQAQASWVSRELSRTNPALTIELVLITTSGDQEAPETPKGGLKALFTKEIEDALLDKRIDLAVHSLKDMAAELPRGLILGAVPLREDARDVWISRQGVRFKDLPDNAVIATSAIRRQAQLLAMKRSFRPATLRGNVDTRLRKLQESDWDGIILAMAGLKRLGLEKKATDILGDEMLPAVGQGALGVEIRAHDETVLNLVKSLDHAPSHQAIRAERAFLHAMGGSCQTPLAAHARLQGSRIHMVGLVCAPDGSEALRGTHSGVMEDPEIIGRHLAKSLLSRGADKLLTKFLQ